MNGALPEGWGGALPPVGTLLEWQDLAREVQGITPDLTKLPEELWLSAREGMFIVGSRMTSLKHWPKNTVATEGTWRVYYTGDILGNFTKPWYSKLGDTDKGDTYNCLHLTLATSS